MPEQLSAVNAEGVQTQFDVHGLRIAVRGDWPEVVESLRLDFAWFESVLDPPTAPIEIEIERREPDLDRFGEVEASFVTPRNVVYQQGSQTIIDYFGRALSVLDRERDRLLVQGTDEQLVHEAAYLFMLSRVGAHLDSLSMPRLHALALSGAQGGVALMLPSGGGKSTMALRALRADDVKLLSEDSPLIDRHGMVHPFPLRIGVNATDAETLPAGHVRRIERMEFHPKMLLDLSAFADRIDDQPRPLRHLVIGRRSLGTEARLAPAKRSRAVGTLLREAVVGVGLYQGMEFVLQQGMRDVLRQGGTAAMRATACAGVLRGARVWTLSLGRDHDRNWAAIEPLLRAPAS